MTGCSLSAAPTVPSASLVDILRKLQSVGFCSRLVDVPKADPADGEQVSSLFDQIVSVFLREIYKRADIRPIPVLVGDGSCVDLFKLYSVVEDKGGFDAVTASKAWASVAEAIGLDPRFGGPVRLVFFKYLDELERWMKIVTEKRAVPQRLGYGNSIPLLIKCSSTIGTDQNDSPCSAPSRSKKVYLSPSEGSNQRLQLGSPLGDGDGDFMTLEPINGEFQHHKRKRSDMVSLLNWLKHVARQPFDPSIGRGLSLNKGKGKANGMCRLYIQAKRARKAMFLKRNNRRSLNVPRSQKDSGANSKMGDGSQSVGNLTSISCYEASGHLNGTINGRDLMAAREESNGVKYNPRRRGSSCFEELPSSLSDYPPVRVPIGTNFQAKVPVWTDHPSASPDEPDTLKWLGTRTWPAEDEKKRALVDYGPTGRGKHCTCQCERPGSVNCNRFHIAEKRLQLKREIGPAFFAWGFQSMGEEVALMWKEEEERMFKAAVFHNRPSAEKKFWSQLYLCFPSKGRQKLVSYYFNVFLVGRRSYQNRVTPNNIDSDDEETQFGAVSNPFGYDAIKIHHSESPVCAKNTQYIDLDE